MIEEETPRNKKLRRALDRVLVTRYDKNAQAEYFQIQWFHPGMVRRFEQRRHLNKYQDLLNDPEGFKILYYIHLERMAELSNGKNLNPFPTTKPTVTKFFEHNKDFSKKYRQSYYTRYFSLLQKQEAQDRALLLKTEKVDFKFKFKAKRSRPISISAKGDSEKEFKNVSSQLFNTIHALPQKGALTNYIRAEMMNLYQLPLPVVQDGGIEHVLLTPSFIHLNRALLLPIIKEFTYMHKLANGDLEYLLVLRRWVRSNYEDIVARAEAANVPFTIPDRTVVLPRVSEVMENFGSLMRLYPDNPWDKKLPLIYDHAGKPVYLTGKVMRAIFKVRDYLKGLVAIENISAMVVGGAVYALTGNPMLSGMAGAVVRNAVRGVKYDIPIKQVMPMMVRDVAISAILGAGFSSGRLAEQIILGAMAGAAQSAFMQRRVDIGAIVGAVQNVLLGLLPRQIAHPTVAGLGADAAFKNALIELLETSIYRGIHGLVVSVITDEDALQGLGHGMIYGLGEAGLKIAIYGFRYVPNLNEQILEQENQFQNEHGVGTYNIDTQLMDDTIFRRDGLFQMFYQRSFNFGNQVLMDGQSVGDPDVESHELSHRMQNRQYGILGFNTRYVLEFFKNGSNGIAAGQANVFENYRHISFNHGLIKLGANAGTPVGMQVFEGALGTVGGVRNPQ